MKIILNGSKIEVKLDTSDEPPIPVVEDVLPVDALRYAKVFKELAKILIEEFPNEEVKHDR